MHLTYDPEARAVYVTLRDVPSVDYTRELDTDRLVDYVAGEPVGVELLNVHLGVNTDGLPAAERIAQLLRQELGMRPARQYLLPAEPGPMPVR